MDPERKELQEDLETINKIIEPLTNDQAQEHIRYCLDNLRARAQALRDRIRAVVASTNRPPTVFSGEKGNPATEKGTVSDAKYNIVQIFRGLQLGKIVNIAGDPLSPSPFAVETLREIERRIHPLDVPEASAPELLDILDKLVTGGVNDIARLQSIFSTENSSLRDINPFLYRQIARAFQEVARNHGYSDTDARAMFPEDPLTAEEVARQLEIDRRERERREIKGGEINLPHSARLSVTESEELNNYAHRIVTNPNLSYEQSQLILDHLFGDGLRDDDRALLAASGMTQEEIRHLEELGSILNHMPVPGSELERYFQRNEQELFTYDEMARLLNQSQGRLTPEILHLYKRVALRAANRLLSIVDQQPDRDFRDNYSELHEGRIFREIQEIVMRFAADPRIRTLLGGEDSDQYQEFRRFMEEGILQELSREREIRELYHNIGIWIKTSDPEQLAKFISRYDLSMITSQINSDVSGKLVDLALSEYERYMQTNQALNRNCVSTGLFSSGVRPDIILFTDEDRNRLRQQFLRKLRELRAENRATPLRPAGTAVVDIQRFDGANISEYEEWEVDRALRYARGMSLLTTARAFEITASGEPPKHFKGSADNLYKMATYFNPRWKVKFGRGGKIMHFDEILKTVPSTQPRSLLGRIFCRGWDPGRIHEEVRREAATQAARHWRRIEDNWLNRNQEFQKLLRLFNEGAAGGLATIAGWRMDGVKALYREHTGRSIDRDWEAAYEWLTGYVGAGARFFFDGDRAQKFAERELFRFLGRSGAIAAGRIPESEQKMMISEFSEGRNALKKIYSTPDGERLTFSELAEVRQHVLRGENFYALLRRSPADFLNNILQMVPELLCEELGGSADYYFNFDDNALRANIRTALAQRGEPENFATEYENVRRFQNRLVEVWGADNITHLQYIRNFFARVVDWARDRDAGLPNAQRRYTEEVVNPATGAVVVRVKDKNAIVADFQHELVMAFERARMRNATSILPNDVHDNGVRELLFGGGGADGLITHFENVIGAPGSASYQNEFGDDTTLRLGRKGFFYHMGRGWYTEMGHGIHPNTADVDWRLVFKNMPREAGEDALSRMWGGMKEYSDLIDQMRDLDHILWNVAVSGNMNPIYELHQKLHKLEENIKTSGMYEAQYYLATIVSRFFQEHWATRIPWPVGTIYQLLRGKRMSLSKILVGKDAFSMTQDGLFEYFEKLRKMNCLAREGVYSAENLARSVGADKTKIVLTEVIPNVTGALILFILYWYLFQSFNEARGKSERR